MPFQSEKQRKYLWANEPAIAKRWEKYPKGYNTGGVSHLFRSKYDTGDYNSGGYVRPEEDGVLGLADGGRTKFRRGTSGAPGGGDPGMTSDPSGAGQTHQSNEPDRGPAHLSHNAPVTPIVPPITGDGDQKTITYDDTKTTIDETDDESVVSFNRITGKKMTARDNLIATRFENLVNNKGYYLSENATNDERNLYEAFLEATGLGENPPTKINSETIRRVNSVNENTFTNLSRHSSFENLLTGDIKREQVLGQGPGEDIKTTTRMMTPQGIWEDGRFIKGLTAPQSWGVQPRNFTRYADGGISQLVKPGPGRPGYGGPHETWGGGAEAGRDPDPPSHSDDGNDGNDHGAGNPDQFNMTPPAQNFPDWESGSDENTWATMSDEMAEKSKAETERVLGDHGDPMGSPDERAKYARYVKYNVKDQTKKEDSKLVKFLKNAAMVVIPGLLPAKLAFAWNTGTNIAKYQRGDYDKYIPDKFSDFRSDGKFSTGIQDSMKENFEKIKADQAKLALYKSLPDGHPEKIQLQIDLQIGKKPEHLGDGDNIDITYENIEETNDLKEKVRASKETMDLLYAPEKEDRSKQMAYWQSLMAPYMGGAMGMAAEGGRVPGYNTGGLSSLFRLKNK